jgi:hypothetical protein
MSASRYRLTNPTMAMVQEDGHHVSLTVPSGSIIEVDGEAFNGEKLVDVYWDSRKIMMFTQDLRSRTERVE